MQQTELQDCIEKIKTGGKNDIKTANKNIEQLWRGLERGTGERKMFLDIFISEFGNFENIKNESNKIAFISSLKYAFMGADEFDDCFETCKRFVLFCMCNSSGHIRQAMIYASEYLIMFLRLRASDSNNRENDEEDLAKNRNRFGKFIWDIEQMADHYNKKEYNKYKYVENLPPSIYKSLIRMQYDFIRNDYYEKIYQEYKNKKLSEFLPQLTFKYTKLGVDTIKEGFICSVCKKSKKRIGSSYMHNKKPKMICEDCAIDSYMNAYGYKTREVATARRRRLFDVGYLFQDMIVDRYLAENNISSIGKLSTDEMQNIFMLGKDMYNTFFDKGDKIELEEIADQEDIKKKLQAVLDGGNFDWEIFKENY
ncbi:MAG: hypothetical protein Q7U36_04045 [bacterium]|nr:hypothetical protein [bacterium]